MVQATREMKQMRDADGRWSSSPTIGVSDMAFLVASDGGGSKVVVVVIGDQQMVRSVFQRLGFRHESLAATNIDYRHSPADINFMLCDSEFPIEGTILVGIVFYFDF
ncbi:hypothetical protein Hanom_Chr16g01506401 [Helianthus anomalus]